MTGSPFYDWTGGDLAGAHPLLTSVRWPHLSISQSEPSSPIGMCVEEHFLYTVTFLHRGASMFWVVVPPDYYQRLECSLARYQQLYWGSEWSGLPRCSQFVRHLLL